MTRWKRLFEFVGDITSEPLMYAVALLMVTTAMSVPSVLLRRRGRPTSALAWLLALFALPGFGLVAWWAVGRTRLERRLRKHVKTKQAFVRQQGTPPGGQETRFDRLLPDRASNEYAFSSPGNQVSFLGDGKNAFSSLKDALENARLCIHLEFYIFRLDHTGRDLSDLLIKKSKQGVRVRLLLDGLGCQGTATKLKRLLSPHGIEVGVFLPSRISPLHAPRFNFVNHRKIVVVDNQIAFTGGMNVGEEYEHVWRDLMLRFRGPVVAGLHHIFLEDWYFATKRLIADPLRDEHESNEAGCAVAVVSSGPDTESWIHDAYFLAITRAEQRLYLTTPYFVPTQPILTALRTAAGRGIDVRIVVPSLSDVNLVKWASRSFYGQLVEAGVRIFEYAGPMLHAKSMLVDQDLVSIGSANIDNRSFRLNFEVNCFVESEKLCSELEEWILPLFDTSTEMTLDYLTNKSTRRKLVESAAHLLSPLL